MISIYESEDGLRVMIGRNEEDIHVTQYENETQIIEGSIEAIQNMIECISEEQDE